MVYVQNLFFAQKNFILNLFPLFCLQGAAACRRLLQVRVLVGQHQAEGGHEVTHQEGAVLKRGQSMTSHLLLLIRS